MNKYVPGTRKNTKYLPSNSALPVSVTGQGSSTGPENNNDHYYTVLILLGTLLLDIVGASLPAS